MTQVGLLREAWRLYRSESVAGTVAAVVLVVAVAWPLIASRGQK